MGKKNRRWGGADSLYDIAKETEQRQEPTFLDALRDTRNHNSCKYCGVTICWINKKPYTPDGFYHRCPNYKKPEKVKVREVDSGVLRQLADLREEVEFMKRLVQQLETPKTQPTNDFEKRIARLESIVVEINRKLPQEGMKECS